MILIPENRFEQIISGDNIAPQNRLEWFLQQTVPLIVTLTREEDTYSADHNYEDVAQADAAHRPVELRYGWARYRLVRCSSSGATFSYVDNEDEYLTLHMVTLWNDGSIIVRTIRASGEEPI